MDMARTTCLVLLVSCFALLARVHAQDADTLGIPLKPDPPFAIDGELGDWSAVPNALAISTPEQVVWGSGSWTTAADLSGVVRFAWRNEYFFVAAEVTDDALRQSLRGDSLWKGDHIELYIDARPEEEPDRDSFGAGQFHIAVSPGNFKVSGDPLNDTSPEVFVYHPNHAPAAGALVAAKQTANGYALEAAIPWEVFGLTAVVEGLPLRVEAGLSDTDSVEPGQEALATTGTGKWGHTRSRLRPAMLSGTDGKAEAVARGAKIFDTLEVQLGTGKEFAFDVSDIPSNLEAVLTLQARLQTDNVAGYTHCMRVTLNGQSLDSTRLLNKPLRVKSRGGQVYSMAAGDLMSTFYSPDFDSPDVDSHYGLLDGIKACRFDFRVTDLIKQGANTLKIENAAPESVTNVLVVGGATLAFNPAAQAKKEKAGPPTGPLARHEPRTVPVVFKAAQTDAPIIEISVRDDVFVVKSRFSTPKPEWVQGSNDFFRHERTIETLPDAVIVRETFTNLTNDKLPIMQRHEVELGDRQKLLMLSGLNQASGSGSTNAPSNPTTFAGTENAGIGMLPLNDVMRIHAANYGVGGAAGMGDNNLVLPPGAAYTAEWAIIPTDAPDYWQFINAAR
ncbi:MAG: hypothetical protein IT365_16620, partial [Candidatus Hydrogenedentes bacterium]|nr:hypothetical protein [Candidatus Hydrogenedentota bacterium]